MNNENIRKVLNAFREKASTLGMEVVVDEDFFIDNDHLNCFWYGGRFATFLHNGWKMHLEVNGDVYVSSENESFCYNNRCNDGAWGHDICAYIKDDKCLDALKRESKIVFENSNWIEWLIQPPNSERIMNLYPAVDTLLETDNVLEAFDNPAFYFDILKHYEGDEL